MTSSRLVRRSVGYYWRTNLAVVGGVAVAVGVLTGALLVGDSVRGSLRELFLSRLGNAGHVVIANRFFRAALADEMAPLEAVPLIAFEGLVTHEGSGRRLANVQVYGVDERFWEFHDAVPPGLSGREALATRALAEELGIQIGDAILLRVETPAEVSRGSLHGRKDQTGRTIRLTARGGLAETGLPEFSTYPQQDHVRGVFVPLERLQRELGRVERVNTLLVSQPSEEEPVVRRLQEVTTLEDLGVEVRELSASDALGVESAALMLSEPVVAAATDVARELGTPTTSLFTYLANTLRVGDDDVPYSLVTAVERAVYRELAGQDASPNGIVLNDWAARDLGSGRGDELAMEFYVWEDEGRIETRSARFQVDAVVPMRGWAADPDLAPDYPGISETENLADWEPPFPIDLSRVRDEDEEYWDRYRATPKAFVPLARGQELWPVRQGRLTSIRFEEVDREDLERRLRERLDPMTLGFSVLPVREQGLAASAGATDFGEYFVYFSYFLVVSALLLAGLFFKLGVEQRLREIGSFLSMGFTPSRIRRLFLAEGALVAILGGLLGIGVAMAYAWIVMYGLRTWWVDAVGTRLLELHLGPVSLAAGFVGGVAVSILAIGLTLRSVEKIPARALLAGDLRTAFLLGLPKRARRARWVGATSLAVSLALAGSASLELLSDVAGFFGAGGLLLVSLLAFQWAWLQARGGGVVEDVSRLGLRNATYRPGRSLVAVALIASATFTIVAVDAFRKRDRAAIVERSSGNGGYALVAESLLPIHWDPNTEEGWDNLNLPYPDDPDAIAWNIQTFRLRPGDDASCLNLYRPQSPRVLAPTGDFLEEGRFRFASSLAEMEEERRNPWLLLEKELPDGAVPVIGDLNSMTYVLHLGLGEDFLLSRVGLEPLRLRLVATLSDSIFQSELLMSERRFQEHFPDVDGFRYLLVATDTDSVERASGLLEERLRDWGVDVETTAARLLSFHRVENTYLSTFQSLGGLGLVLGTLGLAAVLLRNVLERRRELALLRAVGYRKKDFITMVLAENALLLLLGLLTGTLSAAVAIAPALQSRGGELVGSGLWLLLAAVVVSGVLSSLLAVAATLRAPLLDSLRAE